MFAKLPNCQNNLKRNAIASDRVIVELPLYHTNVKDFPELFYNDSYHVAQNRVLRS